MSFTLSANMNLPIPGVGDEPGPQYAQDVNNSLTLVDQHNHTTGSGVQITPSGLNINSNLPINNNNLTLVRTIRFLSQSSALAGISDLGCLYEVGVDLFYNDGAGNQVRVTQGGALAGTPGSIANLVPPASASYVSGTQTFVFQSAANTSANIDGASIIVRKLVSGSPGITIAAPVSLSSDYTLTLPPTPPGQTEALLMDNSGNVNPGLIDMAQLAAAVAQALNPPGAIIAFGGGPGNVPSGYLACDGTTIDRTTYSNLFAAIGTAYGSGDGSTTFQLPDFRGMFLRGIDNGATNDPDTNSRIASGVGGNTGDAAGSKQLSAFQLHSHTITDPGHNHSFTYGASSGSTTLIPNVSGQNPFTPLNTRIVTSSFTGINGTNGFGGSNSQTMPINVYVSYLIKF